MFVVKEENYMKHFNIGLLFILLMFFLSCSENQKEVSEDQLIGMRTTATDFMKDLKSILIEKIQSGGVLNAVSVCSDTAQVLTNKFGMERGIYIKRVSLKNRNPNNYPDDLEKGILNQFELLQQNKELNNKTEFAEIITEGDYKYLRYLKPIIVQAECLNCHGSQTEIMPDVKNLIAQNYPDDKAIGYKTGDLRGAVSIKKVIE
jgi:hypothetical protein